MFYRVRIGIIENNSVSYIDDNTEITRRVEESMNEIEIPLL